MSEKCSICGCEYGTFAFKGGYICDNCVRYLKADFQMDSTVRSEK